MPKDLKNLKLIVEKLFTKNYDCNFEDLKLGDLEKWDSIGHFNLLLAVEKEYGLRFSNEQISEIKSIREIIAILENKNVK